MQVNVVFSVECFYQEVLFIEYFGCKRHSKQVYYTVYAI